MQFGSVRMRISATVVVLASLCASFAAGFPKDEIPTIEDGSTDLGNATASTEEATMRIGEETTSEETSSVTEVEDDSSAVSDVRGNTADELRILGGTDATAGQFPYVAYVLSTLADASTVDCGGTVISSTYVITSAQCVVLAASIKVNAGSLDAATDVQASSGTAIINPGFRRYSLVNDIALVKLLSPFTLGSLVNPIKLPNTKKVQSASSLDYFTVRLFGWGPATTTGAITTALKYVDMVGISKSSCDNKMLELWVLYPASHSCVDTSASTKGFCIGDKGGPVTYTFPGESVPTLVGVMSDFTACPGAYPDAYTRVGPHLAWIKQNVKNLPV